MTTLTVGPADTTLPTGTGHPAVSARSMLEAATAWGRSSDISARSALVTILGDTVAPLGGTVWLSDVIALAQPFGFSERLVRTSMFRLAAEGWVASERVGRQSRYSLTDYGREETRAAEQRIYRPRAGTGDAAGDGAWDGSWTLVFVPPGGEGADELARHLRWRGFAPMADGVAARPNDSVAETRRLLDRLDIEPPPPVAAARFDGDGEAPVVGRGFRDESGLADAEAAYQRFLDRYGPVDPDGVGRPLDPTAGFALRTMVVHDLRRARLRDPDLPAAVLPADWVGHRAIGLAAELYRAVTAPAWRWVEEITGLTVDPTTPPLSERFSEEATP